MEDLIASLRAVVERREPPDPAEFARCMESGVEALEGEPLERRPRDSRGRPGGLVLLRSDLPCVVVPDVHARLDLLCSVLAFSSPNHGIPGRLLDALAAGRAQLVFLGDYVHAEARAWRRWVAAYGEHQDGYSTRRAMDAEMTESLGALCFVATLKSGLTPFVHCLKGNHENITNEDREGNLPFGKFVYEGQMVADYMRRFYGGTPLEAAYRFEKLLPLLAAGAGFLAGHAEPARFVSPRELAEYRRRADVVEALTWTANDAAEPGSVERMLSAYLPEAEAAVYLGGHRPVNGRYQVRADGRYIQLHNPGRFTAAVLTGRSPFSPDRDIVEIPRDCSLLSDRPIGP